MRAQLATLLCFAAVNLAAFTLGRPLLAVLGGAREDRLRANLWRLVAGLLLAATALAILGAAGLLQRSLIQGLTLAACLAHLPFLGSYFRSRGQRAAAGDAGPDRLEDLDPLPRDAPSRPLLAGVLLLAGIACLSALLVALSPPTAADAWGYRLESAKLSLADQRFAHLPGQDAEPPAISAMWDLWGMAMDGAVCAQLIHWQWGLLLGLATVLLATPILGRSWSWIAGAGVLLMPGVCGPLGAGPDELPAAVLVTLATAAWWLAVVSGQPRQWHILAALAVAGAVGLSREALLLPLAVTPVWLWLSGRPKIISGCGGAAVPAARAGETPVILGGPLGGSGRKWAWSLAAAALGLLAIGTAGALLWSRFPAGIRHGGEMGAVLVALLPGLVLTRRLRGLGVLLAVALGYWLCACLVQREVRLPLSVVPMAVVAGVWVVVELRRFPIVARRAAIAVLLAISVAASTVAVPWASCYARIAVASGMESREDFLLIHEPTFSAVLLSRLFLSPRAHILSQEPHIFYFDRRITLESNYRQAKPYDGQSCRPSELGERLRRDGFSHLLLVDSPSVTAAQRDSTLSTWADSRSRDDWPTIRTLAEYSFPTADGTVRRYRLIELR